jgi:hypothetical protein
MTSPKLSPQANSDFWGKDGVVPFIGQVEDVNDPKQSGRVKVRCVGWHPKDKKEMSTEDLPWSHVAMPTTHAQQARIGGKHGLLNGCWVMGIFLDGQEAQKPFIMNTFNFVANSVDKDNKVETQGQDGTDTEGDIAFRNTMVSPQTQPNASLRTKEEKSKGFNAKSDKAGNYLTSDADSDCHGQKANQSQASDQRQNQKQTKDAPEAQDADARQADGHCGDVPHATEDIQSKIQEMMPSMASRFTYGDVVWNNFSGNYMDINGIMAQMSYVICNTMKGNINSTKAFVNEMNRKIHSQILGPGGFTMSREPILVEVRDIAASDKDDIFNAMMQMLIDMLCQMVMGMLQGMNNQGKGDQPEGSPDVIGANPETDIQDPSDICIASTIVDNVATLTDQWIEMSLENSDQESQSPQSSGGGGSSMMSGASNVLMFLLNQNYSGKKLFHNVMGTASQDVLTKEGGCRQDRIYNTRTGAKGSNMGMMDAASGAMSSGFGGQGTGGSGSGQGGAGGGGSETGSSNNNAFVDRLPHVGFGGLDKDTLTGTTRTELCQGATLPIIDDPGFDGTNPDGPPGPGEPGGPCGPGNTCPDGFTCVDGICVPGTPCGPGGSCPPGYICVDGVCIPEKPIFCDDDGNCPYGYVCVDGICIPTGTDILEPGAKGKEFWVTCCGENAGATYVSANGSRAKAGDCYLTTTKNIDTESKLVTAGGVGGETVTINGIPVVAGGVGGAPVFAGKSRLSTSYGIPVMVGATGGIPLKCGAREVEGDMRIVLAEVRNESVVTRTRPAGTNAAIIGVPLPSTDAACAKNFIQGTPNQAVIIRPGQKYFYNNKKNDKLAFPSIYIPNYQGSPVPVVDRRSGEMVAVLTRCRSWSSNNPNPPISVLPDNNNIGITTDNKNYDITLGGFYIGNTGFDYRDPIIEIIDKDTGTTNGEVKLITQNGRIVDYDIINSGTGFLRIPQVKITEGSPNQDGTVGGGFGARLYPIMNVVDRSDPEQPSKPQLPPVQFIYCPSKGQRNLY